MSTLFEEEVGYALEREFDPSGIELDWSPVPYITTSGLVHFTFLILAMMMPDSAHSLELEGFNASARFVQLAIDPKEEERVLELVAEGVENQASVKHAGEEGAAGKPEAETTNKKMAIKGSSDELTLRAVRNREIAMGAGIATELSVASPFGTGETSIGRDAEHAIGTLRGEAYGESRGLGGLGIRNAGRSGGGMDERGIGLSDVGTKGRDRKGGKYGRGVVDLGEVGCKTPVFKYLPPDVSGTLDREIIQGVVRRHRREIKYCYEKELQKNKNLAGEVKVKFTIASSGSVISVRIVSSTLKNRVAESCMMNKVRRWVFPEPKNGGLVIVKYPFHFRSK